MSSYITITGDTFELISRKVYGDEGNAKLIQQSNPGVIEPLGSGLELYIPQNSETVNRNSIQSGEAKNEIKVLIDGYDFKYWDNISIVRSIDSLDLLSISAPFEPKSKELRRVVRPFQYKNVTVLIDDQFGFSGTLISVQPFISPNRKAIEMSCYSRPGVLNDCQLPASFFPEQEHNELTLEEIATNLCAPFGVTVDFREKSGEPFERAQCDPNKKVLAYLVGLAQQRDMIINSSSDGKLVFWKSISEAPPVARMKQGVGPIISVTPTFRPQQYFSHVTAITPTLLGRLGSKHTEVNTKLKTPLRPFTFLSPDVTEGGLEVSAKSKMSRMFADAATYSVVLNTWRDPSGKFWEPNTFIEIEAEDAMIYKPYKFLIRSITFTKGSNSEVATLELVMPGAYNGAIPEVLPWD